MSRPAHRQQQPLKEHMGKDRVVKDRRQAVDMLLDHVQPGPALRLRPVEAVGRVLAAHVHAVCDVPEVSSSARDGYALRASDTRAASKDEPVEIPADGLIPAEETNPGRLGAGRALRVLTGAPVPGGADAVVADEDVSHAKGGIVLGMPARAGQHVLPAGTDIRRGTRIALPGERITPQAAAVMVRSRVDEVSVFPRPRAAVFVLGSELADPYASAPTESAGAGGSSGRMPADNAVLTSQLLERGGFEVVRRMVLPDDAEALGSALHQAGEFDLAVTTGGTGRSERDMARRGAEAAGFAPVFGSVDIRPGKGMFAAAKEGAVLLGLPGPPGAVFACLHVFVPALAAKLQGLAPGGPTQALAGSELVPVKQGEWVVPCRIRRTGASTTADPLTEKLEPYALLARADGVLVVPFGPVVAAGQCVELLLI